jgi:hypothetical protein
MAKDAAAEGDETLSLALCTALVVGAQGLAVNVCEWHCVLTRECVERTSALLAGGRLPTFVPGDPAKGAP